MDLLAFVHIVTNRFYRQFDFKDDTYYWVYAIYDDNSLVAQDAKTDRFFKVNFTYENSDDPSTSPLVFSFDSKDQWEEMQYTFVPVEGQQQPVTEEQRSQKEQILAQRRGTGNQSGVITRSFKRGEFDFDATTRKFSGYGVVFNSDSVPLVVRHQGQEIRVVERITADCVRDAIMDDVVSAFNHDLNIIFGRTSAGTMRLTVDETGIRYDYDVPNTSAGNDLLVSVERGDISGSSFMFNIDSDEGYDFQRREDGTIVATPRKITRIMEMGPVVFPAYPQTTAENRSQLGQALKDYLERQDNGNQQNSQLISDDKMRHLKAKLRHNEEAAA